MHNNQYYVIELCRRWKLWQHNQNCATTTMMSISFRHVRKKMAPKKVPTKQKISLTIWPMVCCRMIWVFSSSFINILIFDFFFFFFFLCVFCVQSADSFVLNAHFEWNCIFFWKFTLKICFFKSSWFGVSFFFFK